MEISIYLFLCVLVCAFALCVHMCMEVRGQPYMSFLSTPSNLFLRQGLQWPGSSSFDWVGCSAALGIILPPHVPCWDYTRVSPHLAFDKGSGDQT